MTKRAFEGESLFEIIKSGDVEEVEMYIQNMVTKKDDRADLRSKHVMEDALRHRKFDVALRILEIADVDLKLRGKLGRTALHYACWSNKKTIVRRIIQLDPSVMNIKDKFSKLPVHYALQNDNVEVFKLLVENTHLIGDYKDLIW